MDPVVSNGVALLDAADLETVSGGMSGWCGNDPLFWKSPPPPPDPLFVSVVSVLDKVALNPQPLPPKVAIAY
jgi:hypothetical protein